MTRIINVPTMTYTALQASARRLNASPLFMTDMLPALWAESLRYNVDPVGVIAQSAHETGWGTFGVGITDGKGVDARWRNTCGLKVRDVTIVPEHKTNPDTPLAHASFASWSIGARAHVEHLVAYAGGTVYDPVDPRYIWVAGKNQCVEFRDLSGRWAGAGYGDRVEEMITSLRG